MKLKSLLFAILSFALLTTSIEAQAKRTAKPVKNKPVNVAAGDIQAQAAISIWYDLNALCRGGSGDSEILTACCARTKVSGLLNQMGYCYRTGDRWVKCTPRDKKAVPGTGRCYD
jgi:hypothetical protein